MLSVADLLASAKTYDGQEVEVVGTLRRGREELSLGMGDEEGPRIWMSLREGTPETEGRLADGKEAVARGVFRAGPSGHLDRFPGQLEPLFYLDRFRPRKHGED